MIAEATLEQVKQAFDQLRAELLQEMASHPPKEQFDIQRRECAAEMAALQRVFTKLSNQSKGL